MRVNVAKRKMNEYINDDDRSKDKIDTMINYCKIIELSLPSFAFNKLICRS
jgi:hypothetical protein